MRRKILRSLLLVLLLAVAGGSWYFFLRDDRPPLLSEGARCRLGAYTLEDGSLVFVRQRQGEELRLVFEDGGNALLEPEAAGRYRLAGAGSATFDCAAGSLELAMATGKKRGTRIALRERPLSFTSHGDLLRGKIVEPAGTALPAIYVVLVHGSERDSASFGNVWQYLLASRGFGAVVYDKRGTGISEGEYTQDFHLLSDDAVAAIGALHREVPGAYEVGLLGGSQGGWIAPLAATKAKADFVAALYGLAESPLAEDRDEVLLGLADAGFGSAEVKAQALEVVAATGKVMASDFESGWEELAAVKAKYGKEPFFEHLEGEYTGDFVHHPAWLVKLVGPFYDVGTSWEYDPLPTLGKIEADHLWVLGGEDHEAPSARTRELLLGLQATHPKLDVAFFPRADHGIVVYDAAAAGQPRTFRYAPGYFSLVLDWIATRRLPVFRPSTQPAATDDLIVASGAADAAEAAAEAPAQ